jgi:hypothetical protein
LRLSAENVEATATNKLESADNHISNARQRCLSFITEHAQVPDALILTSAFPCVELFSAPESLPQEASGLHVALLADRLSVTGNVLRQRHHMWDKVRTPTALASCLSFSCGQPAPGSRTILFHSEHSSESSKMICDAHVVEAKLLPRVRIPPSSPDCQLCQSSMSMRRTGFTARTDGPGGLMCIVNSICWHSTGVIKVSSFHA